MKYTYVLNQYKYDILYRVINISTDEKLIITIYQIDNKQCEWSILNNIYILPFYKHYGDKILIYYHIINDYYFLFSIWDYYMNIDLMQAIRDKTLLQYYQSLYINLIQLNNITNKINYIKYIILSSYNFNDNYINNNIINYELLNIQFNNFKLKLNQLFNNL